MACFHMSEVAISKLLIHFGETRTRATVSTDTPGFGKHCAFFNKCIGRLKTDLLFLAGPFLLLSLKHDTGCFFSLGFKPLYRLYCRDGGFILIQKKIGAACIAGDVALVIKSPLAPLAQVLRVDHVRRLTWA